MPNPQRDALKQAVRASGLDDAVLRHVQCTGTVAEVSNGLVRKLVEEGRLAELDARRIGLGLAVHALADGDEAAVAAIASRSSRHREDLRAARDLATLDPSDVEQAFEEAGVEPPEGETLTFYAARVTSQIAEMFPADTMLQRSTNLTDEVVGAMKTPSTAATVNRPISPSCMPSSTSTQG